MTLDAHMSDVDVGDILVDDPAAPDDDADIEVVTTRRAITRVVMVAAETASRFAREAIRHDPVAWMCAPRRLFLGGRAIDACLTLENFQRAILLHGLSLGLDVEQADLDDLCRDEPSGDRYFAFETDHGGSVPSVIDGVTLLAVGSDAARVRLELSSVGSGPDGVCHLALRGSGLEAGPTGAFGNVGSHLPTSTAHRGRAPARTASRMGGGRAGRKRAG